MGYQPRKAQNAMAFIPILNCALLSAQFQDADGVLAINRHYFATASVPTLEDLTDIADGYMDFAIEGYKAVMESNWSLTGVVVRAMNVEAGLEYNQPTLLPVNGDLGSGRLPNQVTYTVTWLTGLVGRSYRGRTYAVGVSAAAVATGQKRLTDASQAGLQSVWEGLRSSMETAGHAMQVVSLYEDGLPRVEGVTTPIVSTRVNFPLATQRRRLR